MKKINKKTTFIIITIILSVIFLGGIAFSRKGIVIENISEIIPNEEISDEQLRYTKILLYYINEETGEIEAEYKKIDSKILVENAPEEIIRIWLAGPEGEKIICGCSENTKLNNIKIENDCAVVDFSQEFLEKEENIEELKIVYCIVNTLTELNEINSVKILINGEENIYYGSINLSEKYVRLNQ